MLPHPKQREAGGGRREAGGGRRGAGGGPRVGGERAEPAPRRTCRRGYTARLTVTPHHRLMVPLCPALCQVWGRLTTTSYPEEDPRTSRGPYSQREREEPWVGLEKTSLERRRAAVRGDKGAPGDSVENWN